MTSELIKVPSMSPNFAAVNTARASIAAPPARVWALLFDRRAWMVTFAGKERLDGHADSVGERALYRSDHGKGEVGTRLEEVLILDTGRRLVLRLAAMDDSVTTAFVDWRLSPSAEGTSLELNVYWLDVPEAGMDWAAVRALRSEYMAHTQSLIDGHLRRIHDAALRNELQTTRNTLCDY